ncbi:MAG: preprotein translocase subunit SecE [bacterium]
MKVKISQLPKKAVEFIREVYVELKKVTWLTRKETIKYTLIVIGVSLVLAMFLGGWDFFFSWLLGKMI